jgi:hypothetical protein
VISALTRLGLDPWQESGRLSSLSNREAVEQLARLIAELPGLFRPLDEARQIADHLIQLLPRHDTDRRSTPQVQIRLCYLRSALSRTSPLWVACLVLAVQGRDAKGKPIVVERFGPIRIVTARR